ncbi:MAG: hypothetical protein OXF02_05705 [Simkaniaceae bacterium]|nr:hypothetical protein [Simkaniaceae bacterium]
MKILPPEESRRILRMRFFGARSREGKDEAKLPSRVTEIAPASPEQPVDDAGAPPPPWGEKRRRR